MRITHYGILILLAGLFFVLPSCSEDSTEAVGADQSQAEGGSQSALEGEGVANAKTTVKWDTTFHDFGKVQEGEVYRFKYYFTNTGTEPLVIKKAFGSCGCTTSEWTQDPVPPGERGFVEALFDSKGKEGITKGKYVTAIMNTAPDKAHKLKFEAEVLK